MEDSLKANPAGTPPPPGAQTVYITEAQKQATNSVQIPSGSKAEQSAA